MTETHAAGAASADRFDIVIAGGGYVGLSLGLALVRALPDVSVAVVDARPPQTDPAEAAKDPRASAIAAAARRMLAELGVWDEIAPASQPILDMIVTDSRLDDKVRPVFLTFDGRTENGEPFAHMVPNAVMVGALARAALAAGVTLIAPDTVADFSVSAARTDVTLGSGRRLTASLLVAADGAKSKLRALSGIRTVSWSYGQSGIVATLEHELPHDGRAEEHFLPSGPFATLPLPGNRSSLVWSEKTAVAHRLIGDEILFEAELMRRMGHRFGKVSVIGRPQAFPLGLTLARDFVRPRFALVGDAAHGIHPIAGQGLNMGFRDVAALAEVLVCAMRIGEDPGAIDVLERYQRWRRFDTAEMAIVTDVLNRLFSNDLAPIRALRTFGLGLVDRLPKLKQRFIGEAAGERGDLPKMLRGLPI